MRFDSRPFPLRIVCSLLGAVVGVCVFCALQLTPLASAQVFRAPDPGTGSVGLTGGELYGFERVGRLLAGSPSPETVMAASCDFGQDDDITVLALTRL